MPSDMEEELIAQRDAAIAVTKELQRQLQQHREVVERTIERRALNAERLRFHAEEQLRRTQDEREWEAAMCSRLLYMSLFSGMIGALIGWLCGLLVFVAFAQPLVGFLMILPGMACGTLTGLAIAKTRIQIDSRRRLAKQRRSSRHAEVEMAVNGSVDAANNALDPLTGVASSVIDETTAAAAASVASLQRDAVAEDERGAQSWWGFGWSVTSTTLWTSVDIVKGVYNSEYVRGVISSAPTTTSSTTAAASTHDSPRKDKVQ